MYHWLYYPISSNYNIGLLRCNGQDVSLKGSSKNTVSKSKNRIMMVLPFQLGLPSKFQDFKIGTLRNLNTAEPQMDVKTANVGDINNLLDNIICPINHSINRMMYLLIVC